ncbi:hypothetical protein CEP48_05615 [Mergibacter septicus]|uniref:UPF0250 protein CEP48_05615 n=1 Tax=Mergibacter septicus TaxID=221402 RepID=A0A8D4IYB7_9PAST|nr:DUF493 family protein YbeD [Mergibacter septicus]AWX15684.1 hypothetical protein CEP47_05615 [Mergibacter septicus]QDJ14937.1 hypothetical protein CEP48_05615 [Mergibacter septicus]UTU47636.1 DUF493 family protein [Mergibacter septicus]WMR96758.1 DUF493 family protein YbeD [Mergibacter septicus]
MDTTKTANKTEQTQPTLKDLLQFPCHFPFKVVGETDKNLVDQVVATVQKYVPGDYSPTIKPSRTGKYESVSITIYATNIEQVETLYKELAAIPHVRMVL